MLRFFVLYEDLATMFCVHACFTAARRSVPVWEESVRMVLRWIKVKLFSFLFLSFLFLITLCRICIVDKFYWTCYMFSHFHGSAVTCTFFLLYAYICGKWYKLFTVLFFSSHCRSIQWTSLLFLVYMWQWCSPALLWFVSIQDISKLLSVCCWARSQG